MSGVRRKMNLIYGSKFIIKSCEETTRSQVCQYRTRILERSKIKAIYLNLN